MNETVEVVSVKKKMSKTPFVAGLVIIVVIAVLIFMGFLYAGAKLSYQKVTVHASVCDTESALNTINTYFSSSEDSSAAKYKDGISKVKSYQHYIEDPTCTAVLTRLYFLTGNATDMEQMLNKTKEFATKGLYPSNRVKSSLSLSEAEQDLLVIKE